MTDLVVIQVSKPGDLALFDINCMDAVSSFFVCCVDLCLILV